MDSAAFAAYHHGKPYLIGNSEQLVGHISSTGAKWVVLKAGVGTLSEPEFDKDFITQCHRYGMRVLGYHLLSAKEPKDEIKRAKYILNLKDSNGILIDGLVYMPASNKYKTNYYTDKLPSDAEYYYQAVLKIRNDDNPNALLVYCPVANYKTYAAYHKAFIGVPLGVHPDAIMIRAFWGCDPGKYDKMLGQNGYLSDWLSNHDKIDWIILGQAQPPCSPKVPSHVHDLLIFCRCNGFPAAFYSYEHFSQADKFQFSLFNY